jgi:hypothetical protein
MRTLNRIQPVNAMQSIHLETAQILTARHPLFSAELLLPPHRLSGRVLLTHQELCR